MRYGSHDCGRQTLQTLQTLCEAVVVDAAGGADDATGLLSFCRRWATLKARAMRRLRVFLAGAPDEPGVRSFAVGAGDGDRPMARCAARASA